MKSIGVRELRQNASEYLRLVKAGETVEIHERGRPIALLSPIPAEPKSLLQDLFDRGILIPAKNPGAFLTVEPREPRPGERPLSELLQEMRDAERY